jgi:hypothetical protein
MRALFFAALLSAASGCGKSATTGDDGRGERPAAARTGGRAPSRPLGRTKWSIEEARKQLVGKTRDEVKEKIGKPDDTLEYASGSGSSWTYDDTELIWDAAAEKYHTPFSVEFDRLGRCADVR